MKEKLLAASSMLPSMSPIMLILIPILALLALIKPISPILVPLMVASPPILALFWLK